MFGQWGAGGEWGGQAEDAGQVFVFIPGEGGGQKANRQRGEELTAAANLILPPCLRGTL